MGLVGVGTGVGKGLIFAGKEGKVVEVTVSILNVVAGGIVLCEDDRGFWVFFLDVRAIRVDLL